MTGTAQRNGPRRALIVDVDRSRATSLAEAIARHGVPSFRVDTGSAAVRRIESGDDRLVVVAALADGSARAFIGWVRRNYPGLPVLAVATGIDQSLELAVFGADHVVEFPAAPELLNAHLHTLLSGADSLQLAA